MHKTTSTEGLKGEKELEYTFKEIMEISQAVSSYYQLPIPFVNGGDAQLYSSLASPSFSIHAYPAVAPAHHQCPSQSSDDVPCTRGHYETQRC